MNEKIPPLL